MTPVKQVEESAPVKREIKREEREPAKPPEPIKEPDNELDRLAKILGRANPGATEESIRKEAAAMVTTVPGETGRGTEKPQEERKEPPEIAGNEDKNFDSQSQHA